VFPTEYFIGNHKVGDLSLKGRVGDSRQGIRLTTANCVAFRFGVNNKLTGATVQRTDCPPLFAFKMNFSMLGYLIRENQKNPAILFFEHCL
jgi:hypothetical protein